MTEKREMNVMFGKISGKPNSYATRISIPRPWVDALGFTLDDRKAIIEFDGDKIIIKKKA
ncbi:MAG: AbrB/MazE/SpoVT family DNA-binding domain-containing protein [Culicoidibacterales bacterium]